MGVDNSIHFDGGHSIIKMRAGDAEHSFPHALIPLTVSEYEGALSTFGAPPNGLLWIEGFGAFVIGDDAERFGLITRHTGAARYQRPYLCPLMLGAIAMMDLPNGEYKVFVGYPPGDYMYRETLKETLVGRYQITQGGRERQYNIVYANAWPEPFGGWSNVVFSDSGTVVRSDVNAGDTLCIDVGGGTTSFVAIRRDGVVDFNLRYSLPGVGILNVLRTFEDSLRTVHRVAFQNTSSIPGWLLRDALRTGALVVGGGDPIQCQGLATAALDVYLNKLRVAFQQHAGGALPWRTIIVTGGGAGVVFDRLPALFGHNNVIMAGERNSIHMANVRGAQKLWRIGQQQGWFD
jgi:hypothetical protein